jgi:hypothetical protein
MLQHMHISSLAVMLPVCCCLCAAACVLLPVCCCLCAAACVLLPVCCCLCAVCFRALQRTAASTICCAALPVPFLAGMLLACYHLSPSLPCVAPQDTVSSSASSDVSPPDAAAEDDDSAADYEPGGERHGARGGRPGGSRAAGRSRRGVKKKRFRLTMGHRAPGRRPGSSQRRDAGAAQQGSRQRSTIFKLPSSPGARLQLPGQGSPWGAPAPAGHWEVPGLAGQPAVAAMAAAAQIRQGGAPGSADPSPRRSPAGARPGQGGWAAAAARPVQARRALLDALVACGLAGSDEDEDTVIGEALQRSVWDMVHMCSGAAASFRHCCRLLSWCWQGRLHRHALCWAVPRAHLLHMCPTHLYAGSMPHTLRQQHLSDQLTCTL